MKKTLGAGITAAAAAVASTVSSGQVQMCLGGTAPACQGVRGDRSEGWIPQTLSAKTDNPRVSELNSQGSRHKAQDKNRKAHVQDC